MVFACLVLGCHGSSSTSSTGGHAASGTVTGGVVAGGTVAAGGTLTASGGRGTAGGVTGINGGTPAGGTVGAGGSSGQNGGTSGQGSDGGIANCVEGLSCPQAGLQCMNAEGVACLCGGPPGSAFLTCNVVGAGGSGGSASVNRGGTTAAGGGKITGGTVTGGKAMGGVVTGGVASGGTAAGGTTTGGTSPAGGAVGQACAGSAPWGTGNGDTQIVVDAAQKGQPWSRFYEKGVACDHAHTLISTAYGRNAQAALKKGHDQAGFQYVRFHGVLDSDIGVYSETNGTPAYNWTNFDQVYDGIVAAGMRPVVELSFTPPDLSSTPSKILTTLWYNSVSPTISPPKDWTKWQNFMTAIVQHLETRYGADEVRNNWYFEVWNEPSWMYSLGDAGYNELYGNTVKGLVAGDPLVKVGGPAGSGGESPGMISGLVSYTRTNNLKLDFVSFHCYANDGSGGTADASGILTFYDSLSSTISSSKFTGLVINDEWAGSYDAVVTRDNEVAASFIVKTVHLVGTASKAGPPFMFGYWAISDLYEEFNTGTATAFREGNFGLLLKGDPSIPASFDVAKPAFNAFRLLHMMGDTQISTTGGTTADGVNAVATVASDNSAVQILVYNHVNGGAADSTKSSQVQITVKNIPWTGAVNVRHYMLDRTRSNSYRAWADMGKPAKPTQAQWTQISSAAELCYYETTAAGTSWTATFAQNTYGVSLIVLSH